MESIRSYIHSMNELVIVEGNCAASIHILDKIGIMVGYSEVEVSVYLPRDSINLPIQRIFSELNDKVQYAFGESTISDAIQIDCYQYQFNFITKAGYKLKVNLIFMVDDIKPDFVTYSNIKIRPFKDLYDKLEGINNGIIKMKIKGENVDSIINENAIISYYMDYIRKKMNCL